MAEMEDPETPPKTPSDAKHVERVERMIADVCTLAGRGSRILEVGVGTQLEHLCRYTPGTFVVGIDSSKRDAEDASEARAIAAEAGVSLELVTASLENLPFPDATFDGVVGVFILCSVDDYERAIQEIGRVLRPGAPYGWVEHVRAAEGSKLLAMQLRRDPLQQRDADNCHLARPTDKCLLRMTEGRDGLFSEIRSFERFRVMKMWPVFEQAWGVLVRR